MSVNLSHMVVQLDNDYVYSLTFISLIPCPELRGNALIYYIYYTYIYNIYIYTYMYTYVYIGRMYYFIRFRQQGIFISIETLFKHRSEDFK